MQHVLQELASRLDRNNGKTLLRGNHLRSLYNLSRREQIENLQRRKEKTIHDEKCEKKYEVVEKIQRASTVGGHQEVNKNSLQRVAQMRPRA